MTPLVDMNAFLLLDPSSSNSSTKSNKTPPPPQAKKIQTWTAFATSYNPEINTPAAKVSRKALFDQVDKAEARSRRLLLDEGNPLAYLSSYASAGMDSETSAGSAVSNVDSCDFVLSRREEEPRETKALGTKVDAGSLLMNFT